MVTLPYGRVPYRLDLGNRRATIVEALPAPPAALPRTLFDRALDQPVGRPAIESMVRPGSRVTVIVSDATRSEPRAVFLQTLRARLPSVRWTIAVATGTHGPSGLAGLDLPRDLPVIDHDGHSERDLVDLGTTAHGTPVRVHRCVVETDLVVATGCIRPHYFAGFGAGVKAIFPGVGEAHAIRTNHLLKREPRSRAGIVDGNPCRDDLEAAVARLSTPTYLLNGVCASDGSIQDAVSGDLVAAFRIGAELARPWFTVRATPASLVIASDALPITGSLYQSAKIAAAVAPLVTRTLVLVAECAEGIGPVEVVNEAIFRIGVLPRLPARARIGLLSSLAEADVRQTLVEPLESLETVLHEHSDEILVIPRASQLLVEVS